VVARVEAGCNYYSLAAESRMAARTGVIERGLEVPEMSEITRHGPRFSLLIGFDLGRPLLEIRRYRPGHYAVILFYLEIHLQIGKARDLTLDILDKGIEAMKKEREENQ
jgi:hypothetical protein